ncbi:efflux RND transporter periplasmic adaptor subunit [Ketobacter sp. MCCC 1A13808]|nr:efflux RND transporter periplasmic adaptor subunit [Ketobacter sp. MCCC 1A13808]MVF11836.1 efflux RND transporter periplasmic adaptor subunit [Ketobacter sp. MCCC 1A13808]RLP55437.1 MAG: efflux RND transporter periplasmic adaptor subunit [Ketobacter sp.]
MAVVIAIGWWATSDSEPEHSGATVSVKRGDIEKVVTAQGSIQPRSYVDVGAQVSGQLNHLHVSVGDTVSKGQLLAEIDAAVQQARVDADRAQLDALRAQLSQAKAQWKLARLQYERQDNLRKANATSEDEYQIAEASVASAEAQVKALQAQIKQTTSTLTEDEATLGYTRIFAPMDGIVVSLEVREGVTLNTNQTTPLLMRIADLSTVTVEAEVSEADVTQLNIGMPVYFSLIGSSNRTWNSTLRQILPTPLVENNVVLYTALFDVENTGGYLMSGMTAQISFVLASAAHTILVPVAALEPLPTDPKSPARRYQVAVKQGEKITQREVSVGVRNRIQAQIQSGLKEGELVVLAGAKEPVIQKARRPRGPGLF